MRRYPRRLVLLGHPVSHSLSPVFQNAALQAARIPLEYEALDVSPAQLRPVLRELREAKAAGNITIPHKTASAPSTRSGSNQGICTATTLMSPASTPPFARCSAATRQMDVLCCSAAEAQRQPFSQRRSAGSTLKSQLWHAVRKRRANWQNDFVMSLASKRVWRKPWTARH